MNLKESLYTQRPMTANEREKATRLLIEVRDYAGGIGSTVGFGFIIGSLATVAAMLSMISFKRFIGVDFGVWGFWIPVMLGSILAMIAVGIRTKDRYSLRKGVISQNAEIQDDICTGRVEECVFECDEALEIGDPGTEGGAICYRTGRTAAFIIRSDGNDAKRYREGSLPNATVRVVRLPKSRRILEVEYSGSRIEATSSAEHILDTGRRIDGEVFEVDWAQLGRGACTI